MNIAGPSSRAPPIGRFTRGGRIESTYEGDLLEFLDRLSRDLQEFLDQLSPGEIDEFYTYYAHGMQDSFSSSDHDVAFIHLLQQVRELAHINEDRVLAQQIADEEDVGSEAEESSDDGDVGTEAEESGDEESIGAESIGGDVVETRTQERADEEDAVIETEENGHKHRRLRLVGDHIARFFPKRSWISSLISRLSDSKPILTRRVHVAVPGISAVRRLSRHNCVVCQDAIHGVEIRAPCGHYFDIGCATHLFQSATRDETLFPPRCCGQDIPLSPVQPHLPRTLITTFQQKQTEFGTLKRVYCSSPTCSRFLGPVLEGVPSGPVYTCPALGCRRRTCAKCREQHSSYRTHVCRPDAGATQVVELSRASGWARCPGCSHMIELHLGCFHMTCRCGTEFCYLCCAPWKTCECPQWHEERLVDDDDEIEDRDEDE